MAVDLYVGIPVSDYAAALSWYAGTTGRGLPPATRETYPDGDRKARYLAPDGNEIGSEQVVDLLDLSATIGTVRAC